MPSFLTAQQFCSKTLQDSRCTTHLGRNDQNMTHSPPEAQLQAVIQQLLGSWQNSHQLIDKPGLLPWLYETCQYFFPVHHSLLTEVYVSPL